MATSISFRSGNQLQTIIFDAATSIRPSFKSELSKHPVEKGSDVTDNTRKEPDTVTIDAVITDYPITISGKGIGAAHEAGRSGDILALLLYLKNKGVRVKLETSMRGYSNMQIDSITPNTDRMKGAMKVTISFQESQIVESETVNVVVAANRINQGSQDKGKKVGEAATEKQKSSSYAHKISHSDAGEAFKKVVSNILSP